MTYHQQRQETFEHEKTRNIVVVEWSTDQLLKIVIQPAEKIVLKKMQQP